MLDSPPPRGTLTRSKHHNYLAKSKGEKSENAVYLYACIRVFWFENLPMSHVKIGLKLRLDQFNGNVS